MRKQDRIAQEQSRSPQQREDTSRPQSTRHEQTKGSASSQEPPRPQRTPGGKMPLPD